MGDLAKQLRKRELRVMSDAYEAIYDAADRIEVLEAALRKQEAITKDDTDWLKAYHKWCEMNGCAPSSSDLISARAALEGEKKDEN